MRKLFRDWDCLYQQQNPFKPFHGYEGVLLCYCIDASRFMQAQLAFDAITLYLQQSLHPQRPHGLFQCRLLPR